MNNLTPDPSFGHNLCFKYPNGSCEPILDIYVPRDFQWCKKLFNLIGFDSYNHSLKIWESIGTPTPKVGAHLGMWGYHPLTLSHTLGNMKCDSWASPLVRTFTSPCLGCEPKAKVVTPIIIIHPILQIIVIDYTFLPPLFSFFFQLLLLKQIFNKEYLIIKPASLLHVSKLCYIGVNWRAIRLCLQLNKLPECKAKYHSKLMHLIQCLKVLPFQKTFSCIHLQAHVNSS